MTSNLRLNTIDIASNVLHCKNCGSIDVCINNEFQPIIDDGQDRKEQLDYHLNKLLEIYTINECDNAIVMINDAKRHKIKVEKGKKDIFTLAENGNIEELAEIIDLGIDVNIADAISNTPMHYASKSGNKEVVKLLINCGGNVNSLNDDCNMPIHNASMHGHADLINIFLENGVSINTTNNAMNTPLHLACIGGYSDVVSLLLSRDANINIINRNNQIPLMCADSEDVLLEFVYRHFIKEEHKLSLLIKAIEKSWATLFNKLIHLKIKVNDLTNDEHLDPIITAARFGRAHFIKTLLDYGFDINYKNENNMTVLHILACEGNYEIIKLLLECKANIEETGGELEQTALHFAACNGNIDIVEYLLKQGAQVSKVDKNIRSALHYSALADHVDVILLLLQYGAERDSYDCYGQTPLELAIQKGHDEAVRILYKPQQNFN